MLTDYHNHILPAMDDGATDVKTSIQMLNALEKHGVERVVATPHFYYHRESVESFLERREKAYRQLANKYDTLSIILGAEISLEQGLSREMSLEALTMGQSRLMLLEPPFSIFKRWITEEIYNITYGFRITPVVAHLDRYLHLYSADGLSDIVSIPDVIIQINYDALNHRKTRKFALSLIKEGYPVIFGTDAHDMNARLPNADVLFDILQKKLAKDEWLSLMELNETLI